MIHMDPNIASKPTKLPKPHKGISLYWKRDVIYCTVRHEKQPHVFCTGTSVPKEAAKFAMQKSAELRTGTAMQAKQGIRMGELFEDYLASLRRAERAKGQDKGITLVTEKYSYRAASLIKCHLSELANLKPEQITSDRISGMEDRKTEEGYSLATINGIKRTLNAVLSLGRKTFVMANGRRVPKVDRNIVFDIAIDTKAEERLARTGTVPDDAYEKLMAVLPDWFQAFFAAAMHTGMRPKEIRAIRPEQMDWEAKMIHLRTGETKNGEARVVPMSDELYTILRDWDAQTKREFPGVRPATFFHKNGKRVPGYRMAWERALIKTGYAVPVLNPDGTPKMAISWQKTRRGKPVTPYQLRRKIWKHTILFYDARRTLVTKLDQLGLQEKDIMRAAGHKTSKMSRRYNQSKESAKLMQAAVNGTATVPTPSVPVKVVVGWKAELKELKEAFEDGLLPEDLYKIEAAKVMAARR